MTAKPQSLVSQLRGLTRDSFIYGIGGLVSRFLAVLMLPLYTSYVSPGDYGRVEILMAAMAVAVTLLRGGANYGFIRFYFLERDPEYRRRLVRTVFWAQMAYSTFGLVLCIVLAHDIAGWFGVTRNGPDLHGSGTNLVVATGVLLWANVNYAQMTNLFRAEQRSVAFSIATLANIAITVPLTVILVVIYKEGPLGIIVGNLSGTLVLYVILLAYRREQLGLQFDGKLLHALNRFGLPLMAAALALWVTNFGDRLMLSKLLHGANRLAEVGQYSLANKISSAMVLLFTAFQVDWPADTAVPALAYSSVFYAGFTVVTIATGRTRQTQFNWVAAAFAAVLNFTLNLWLIPAYGMLGAAYATLAAYALLMVVRTWNAQKIYPVAYQWRRVGELLLVAGGLTLAGELLPRSLPLAFGLTLAYPLALGLLGFYLPAERQRLRRLLPAHN